MRGSCYKSLDRCSNDSLSRLSVLSMSRPFDNSVETAMFVYGVLDNSNSTVSFMEGVFTMSNVTFTGFFVGVDVTGVMILYTVFECVLSWCLKIKDTQ